MKIPLELEGIQLPIGCRLAQPEDLADPLLDIREFNRRFTIVVENHDQELNDKCKNDTKNLHKALENALSQKGILFSTLPSHGRKGSERRQNNLIQNIRFYICPPFLASIDEENKLEGRMNRNENILEFAIHVDAQGTIHGIRKWENELNGSYKRMAREQFKKMVLTTLIGKKVELTACYGDWEAMSAIIANAVQTASSVFKGYAALIQQEESAEASSVS